VHRPQIARFFSPPASLVVFPQLGSTLSAYEKLITVRGGHKKRRRGGAVERANK